jgi:hypothetical protein
MISCKHEKDIVGIESLLKDAGKDRFQILINTEENPISEKAIDQFLCKPYVDPSLSGP